MRFERVRAAAFGGLKSFDSGTEPLADLVVVAGPNESGKTTFFHLLGSLLYGIYPASRDQNPYAPWSGHELDISADLRVSDGSPWSVRRRLKASPTAQLKVGDETTSIRNETLPCVTHVSRAVFRQVFALTLSEVASLESEAWSSLQDRLIGAMGARDLVTASSAAGTLEDEAGRLWRPNRKGKQEVRDLKGRLRDARQRKRQAADNDRLLRSAMADLERARADLKEARFLREQQQLLIDRTTTLLPAKKLLDQAAELDREAGPEAELAGIPTDPIAVHERLVEDVAKLEARLARVTEDTKGPTDRIAAFGADETRVLEARAAIENVVAAVAGSTRAHTRLGALEREIQDRGRQVDVAVNEIFERALSDDELHVLRSVAPRQIAERARVVRQLREREREAQIRSSLKQETPEASPTALWMGVAAGLVAGVLLIFGTSSMWPRATGALLALVSVTLLTRWWTVREAHIRGRGQDSRTTPPTQDAELGVDAVRNTDGAQSIEGARADLHGTLENLPVREDLLDEAGPELAATVSRLQELLQDLGARTHETEALRETLAEIRVQISELGTRLELDLPTGDPAAAHVLQSRLRDAQRAEEQATSASRERDSLDRTREEIQQEFDDRTRQLNVLEDSARALEGDVTAGLRTACRRQSARQKADQIREHLMRSHPDLDDLRARIVQMATAEGQPMDDDDYAAARLALRERTEGIEELTGRVKELEHDYARAQELTTVDQVDGEIQALKADLDHLESEHDRKLLLAHVIREADRTFREEHQPDVVRAAAGFLRTITADRYDRISVGDDGAFRVSGAEFDTPVEAARLSTGAREQLYLAIRLAVMNHVDEGRERLPIFVDEAVVNWDSSRRIQGFQLLRQLSSVRQVFVMTCHAPWADELVGLGAQRIDLS